MSAAFASMLSQPVSVHNLTAWFMLAPCDQRPAGEAAAVTFPDYRVLEESIEASLAVLHETGSVNELLIENSGDVDLFIQAGDIVKGGRQDRTIGVDFIVPAQSGRIPLPAFCVEQSRWHRRGGEAADRFSSSKHSLSSKKAHMAMLFAKSQTEVWRSVAEEQAALARALAADSTSAVSPTSLELTYELDHVTRAIDDYTGPLEHAPAVLSADVVGVAWAIDGMPSHADRYASPALFAKRWRKLLRAAATEALRSRPAQGPEGHAPAPASTEEMAGWLATAWGDELPNRPSAAAPAIDTSETAAPPDARQFGSSTDRETWRLPNDASSAEESLPPRTRLRRASGHSAHRVECYDTAVAAAIPLHVAILAS
jgi:hypothetical protein